MTLYEISAAILAATDGADGELPEDLEARLDSLSLSLADKAGNIVRLYRTWLVEAEAIAAERDRLAKMVTVRKNKADRLKDYLCRHLSLIGVDKVETAAGTVAVRTSGTPKVDWDREPGTWAAEWDPMVCEMTQYTPNRPAILAAWKAGEPLPPGVTVERTKFIDVR